MIKKLFNYLFPSEVRTLRLSLWGLLTLVLAIILYLGIVPFGHITYKHNFVGSDEFIGKLTPTDRVNTLADGKKVVIGEPIYFTLHTPRSFDRAKLKLKYKNTKEAPVIETGVLVDKTIWRYDLQPVANRTLDQLGMVWDKTREGDLLLLQRNKEYDSIESFIFNPPERSRVALYNYDIGADYVINDYESVEDPYFIDYPIRGGYEFYTYIKDEEMDINFTFVDLNENNDPDQIDLHLYIDNVLLDARHLDDDGIETDTRERTGERFMNIKLASLPEGVYKLELRANDDIVTKRIETKQKKISFINKLWLMSNSDFDISLYTDSKKLAVKTTDPESLQTIVAGQSQLPIEETYKQFETIIEGASSSDHIHKITLEKDGVILAGNGVFGFTVDAIVNPSFKKVNELFSADDDGVDFVIADYREPHIESGLAVTEIDIDLSRAYREDLKYSFILSLPGLKYEEGSEKGIEISEIEVDLSGKSLFEKIKEKL